MLWFVFYKEISVGYKLTKKKKKKKRKFLQKMYV
jgi:hypothetical protein